jgi:bacterial/archaeal transporter family-2 protein
MTTTEAVRHATIMLIAGIGVPILAALNAQLGNRIASPPGAAVVLFLVASLGASVIAFMTTGLSPLTQISTQPRYLLLGGILIAFYVISITWIAPRFGLGNAIICVLLGQLVSTSAIDHFGLLGSAQHSLTLWRALGLAGMVISVAVVIKS